MIDRDTFFDKMREALIILNRNVRQEMPELAYSRLADQFETEDFLFAIEDCIEEGNVSYANLLKYLRKHQNARIERYAAERKKQEREELAAHLKGKTNCDKRCSVCTNTVCDYAASIYLKGIQAILSGRMKTNEVMNIIKSQGDKYWNRRPNRPIVPEDDYEAEIEQIRRRAFDRVHHPPRVEPLPIDNNIAAEDDDEY